MAGVVCRQSLSRWAALVSRHSDLAAALPRRGWVRTLAAASRDRECHQRGGGDQPRPRLQDSLVGGRTADERLDGQQPSAVASRNGHSKHETSTLATRGRTVVPVTVTTPEHWPPAPTAQRQTRPERRTQSAFHVPAG